MKRHNKYQALPGAKARKSIKPKSFDDDMYPLIAGLTVYEEDWGPEFIGIVDADGNPIYRYPEPKVPMGFHTKPVYDELYDEWYYE